jgi:hypothetical protein
MLSLAENLCLLEIIQALRNFADFRNHLHHAHQIEYSLISVDVTQSVARTI